MKTYVNEDPRELKRKDLRADLVVVGGGLAGTCCAVSAAREGAKVLLVQDRPVLGGNASSEVRLWALGATSHMGNNNRWAREGGVIDEVMVENLYRNKEGNPVLFDAVLLDKVLAEENITLLLDTAVFKGEFRKDGAIRSVSAFCSQSATMYTLEAPLFCDASGDGILGYLAGAPYRVGAEGKDEFGEPLAPDEFYGELLGTTIYFYSKDTDAPVKYTPPEFALKDIAEIPRFNRIKAGDTGCSFWWLEYGGRMDTVHDSQEIKKELWKVSYGIWDYIKNSGNFPEAANLTLEWVGLVPGKRESRRFEGDYMLTQRDIVEQRPFDDAVSYGGWAIDLHPADGVYTDLPPCNQYHGKGVYQIPWRCYYSRTVPNLFLAGRLISSSHVAMGSTRVMMTGAHGGQAVGVGAALCLERGKSPRELLRPELMRTLQARLNRTGQFIPHTAPADPEDLAARANIASSGTMVPGPAEPSGEWRELTEPTGMLLPLKAGAVPEILFPLAVREARELRVQLRLSDRPGNTTPCVVAEEQTHRVSPGDGKLSIRFASALREDSYALICLMPAPGVSVALTNRRLPGVLMLWNSRNEKVAKGTVQTAPEGSGLDSFEFWLPERRPGGRNWALEFRPAPELYSAQFLNRGYERPFIRSNCWVPEGGRTGRVALSWPEPVELSRFILSLDGDADHPMESVQYGHPEERTPFCADRITVLDDEERILWECSDNRLTRIDRSLGKPCRTSRLTFRFAAPGEHPLGVYRIRVF